MLAVLVTWCTAMEDITRGFFSSSGRFQRQYSLQQLMRDGQAEWAYVAWINTGNVTNLCNKCAQRSLTSFEMWPTLLPLRQTNSTMT